MPSDENYSITDLLASLGMLKPAPPGTTLAGAKVPPTQWSQPQDPVNRAFDPPPPMVNAAEPVGYWTRWEDGKIVVTLIDPEDF